MFEGFQFNFVCGEDDLCMIAAGGREEEDAEPQNGSDGERKNALTSTSSLARHIRNKQKLSERITCITALFRHY